MDLEQIKAATRRHPRVEDNLRPTVKYFKSLRVDVAIVLHKTPRNLGLSIEGHLKPVTKFFW
ncbi:hypothetical protein Pint_26828 [Pistacia integerrima]|uniref:Uncharacterized protein n=1 Tax=Pistacia integerrima TaxID=434235 RepID=A0ACC0YP07_9ROSI|nr:hypothetical protein Pint_26828 [Pistacia integerrima]